jgi:pantoate--beta-alanine ligase
MTMKLINSATDMQSISNDLRSLQHRLAFVPTMGALHDGHLSLVHLAKKSSDKVVLSIFVNPLQFTRADDLTRYPRPFDRDTELAESAGVDFLFYPHPNQFYASDFQSFVEVGGVSEKFEGAIRPGHFRGVATVVTKLFNIVQPHDAIFGQKDAQQLTLIRKLIADLNMSVRLIAAPIVREPDGLAMSSRNIFLNKEERKQAPILSKALDCVQEMLIQGERDVIRLRKVIMDLIQTHSIPKMEYVAFVSAADFSETEVLTLGKEFFLILAARFGSVRLLDNLLFTS